MKRFISVVAATAALVWFSTPAEAGGPPPKEGSAASRSASHDSKGWTAWEAADYPSFDYENACVEPVHVTIKKDRVRQRTRKDPGGNIEIESKGRLVVALTLDSQPGRQYRFDVSGPSVGRNTQILYANGDYLARATGANLQPIYGTAIKGTGLPRLGYYVGPYAILFDGTEKADVISRPHKVVDVCAFMGIDSLP